MYGDIGKDGRGQLAVMDAMVFFSVAMLISSIVLVQVGAASRRSGDSALEPPIDVPSILQALMGASLGRTVIVSLESELRIQGQESVAECLSAELYALSGGCYADIFIDLNNAIWDILKALSGPLMAACLLAVHPEGSSDNPLLSIPGPLQTSETAYSSSVELPCGQGLLFTVVLVLYPTSSPELVQI